MKKQHLFLIGILLFIICRADFFAAAEDIKVSAISSSGIVLDAGADQGMRVGLRGTVYYYIEVSGQNRKTRIAKIVITKTEATSSWASVVEKTEDIKVGGSLPSCVG